MYINDVMKVCQSIVTSNTMNEIVPCLKGDPGIGKTYMVYDLAEWIRNNTQYHDCKVVEIIASQILPSEVSGLTMPDAETKSMQVFDHARLSSLQDGDILFFDELLQAPMQVLSACLTLIQERRMMSGKKLPNILIIAATNESVSATSIPESIRQRFMFINIDFNINNWIDWIEEKYGNYLKPDAFTEENVTMLKSLFDKPRKDYNIITPRSITKCLEWMINAYDKDIAIIRLAINNMFGYQMGEHIYSLIKRVNPINKRIYDIILEETDERHDDDILYCSSFRELINNIKEISKETGIDFIEILSEIEMEEVCID